MNFPYQKSPSGDYFPIINLFVSHKDRIAQIHTLIDSGATISILKQDVAEQLNIPIEEGKEIFLGGVGGRIKGYIHNLHMTIGSKTFVAPIVFSYEYSVSFNLLGRSEVFKQFAITFQEKDWLIKMQ